MTLLQPDGLPNHSHQEDVCCHKSQGTSNQNEVRVSVFLSLQVIFKGAHQKKEVNVNTGNRHCPIEKIQMSNVYVMIKTQNTRSLCFLQGNIPILSTDTLIFMAHLYFGMDYIFIQGLSWDLSGFELCMVEVSFKVI